jgi:hypothetical protein
MPFYKVQPDAKTLDAAVQIPPPIPLPAGMNPVKGWFAARVKFGSFNGNNFLWPIINWNSPEGTLDRNGFSVYYWRLDVQVSEGSWSIFMESGLTGMDLFHFGGGPVAGEEHAIVGFWNYSGAECAIAVDTLDQNLSDNDSGNTGGTQDVYDLVLDIGNDSTSLMAVGTPDTWPSDGEILWVAMGNDILTNAEGISIMALGEAVPTLAQLPASAVYVWSPPKVAAVSSDTGTVAAIAPDVVPQGLAPSTSLFPSSTLFPGGSRTGLLPVTPRSGGVLTPILPDFE